MDGDSVLRSKIEISFVQSIMARIEDLDPFGSSRPRLHRGNSRRVTKTAKPLKQVPVHKNLDSPRRRQLLFPSRDLHDANASEVELSSRRHS